MFGFLKLNKKEDKLVVYLGLMRCIMTLDDEFHQEERRYLERFVSNLDDSTRNCVADKVKNINLDQLIGKVKDLTKEDQNELINKLISISALDGNIDGKEAYLISFLANIMGMNVSTVVTHMVNNFGFNEQDLQDEIERMNNQYSMPKGPIANVKRQPPKRRVSSSNVIGYMRHSKLNNNN